MNNYPISRKTNLVIQEMDGEILIYDLITNKAFCLNNTSSIVWQLCDGNKSTEEISRLVGNKLNMPPNEDLVWLAIEQLKKEKLVNGETTIPNKYRGLPRREVIKKIGLGTMIALPLVSSLIAPTAAQGATGCDAVTVTMCLCLRSIAPNNGNTCGSGDSSLSCNAGCTCTRNTTSGGCFLLGGTGPEVCPGACS